jgi:hypothetical protein
MGVWMPGILALPLAGAAWRKKPPPPHAAIAAFTARIENSEQAVRASSACGSVAEQALAYRHLSRAIIRSIESQVLQDADYLYFRILDLWLREGGDNPDPQYAFSPVRGGAAYRIWGKLGSAARDELQLYVGEPWAGTGRSAGYLVFEDIDIETDGSFSTVLTPEASTADARSFLVNPPEATTVFVRHIYDDWNAEQAGDVHIDRVGFEGKRRPAPTPAELATRLQAYRPRPTCSTSPPRSGLPS